MKKILKLTILSAGLLILMGSLAACDKKEEVINTKIPSMEINTFFETYLPVPPVLLSECFFFDQDDREDKYIIINSVDEFIKSFSCSSIMLPVIDFKSSTLIIGQQQMPNSYYFVVEQKMIVKSGKIELSISVNCPDNLYPSFSTLYYWGIYPKNQNKSISVNIINKCKL